MVGVNEERLRAALAEHSLGLDRELGRGGMSVVYLAQDLRHHRLVAVKLLRPGILGGVERFVREIEALSPLVHPNIMPLFDSGVADGHPYFVMPYVDGESLRRRLQLEGRLPIDDALRIAGDVGEALEFAHKHGVLHRDIKPENILLEAGRAVVTDFGVARALSQTGAGPNPGDALTEHGFVLGTAEYMSPEQASADPAIDGRADIYSLGCVIYEMLTGRPPFTGDSPGVVLARRFRETPVPVRQLRPDVSAGLEAAVQKALALDPEQRFATVTEFLKALRLPENSGSAARPRRQNQLWWTSGVAAAAVVGAVAFHDSGTGRLDSHRIAVARWSNETGDSALSYLAPLATDRLTAALAGDSALVVVTSATIMPSRLGWGRPGDSPDDPERLRLLAQETAAGTVVSGSYFRTGDRISFQAELTDANDGALLDAVGPVTASRDRAGEAMDSLGRHLESAIARHVPPQAARY